MGSITRSFANNIGTSGILKAAAFNNASLNNVTALNAAIPTGNMILISSQTASSSASIDFTLGNYKEYQFYFINIHPQNNLVDFQINFSTDNGSNYNVTKTTATFDAYHYENGTNESLQYLTSKDLAQSTGDAMIDFITNANDHSSSGILHLFNPNSTTYVKHFISVANDAWTDGGTGVTQNVFTAGYANTTSALTNIRFKISSGNIDDGTILMYGIV